jgi:diaminopimelate decarboxylase
MHFPCFWEKKFGIEYFPVNKEKQVNTINIFGNSCMQVDKILENQLVTFKPQVGDKIVLTKVGAYSLSQASNFISKIPDIEERE